MKDLRAYRCKIAVDDVHDIPQRLSIILGDDEADIFVHVESSEPVRVDGGDQPPPPPNDPVDGPAGGGGAPRALGGPPPGQKGGVGGGGGDVAADMDGQSAISVTRSPGCVAWVDNSPVQCDGGHPPATALVAASAGRTRRPFRRLEEGGCGPFERGVGEVGGWGDWGRRSRGRGALSSVADRHWNVARQRGRDAQYEAAERRWTRGPRQRKPFGRGGEGGRRAPSTSKDRAPRDAGRCAGAFSGNPGGAEDRLGMLCGGSRSESPQGFSNAGGTPNVVAGLALNTAQGPRLLSLSWVADEPLGPVRICLASLAGFSFRVGYTRADWGLLNAHGLLLASGAASWAFAWELPRAPDFAPTSVRARNNRLLATSRTRGSVSGGVNVFGEVGALAFSGTSRGSSAGPTERAALGITSADGGLSAPLPAPLFGCSEQDSPAAGGGDGGGDGRAIAPVEPTVGGTLRTQATRSSTHLACRVDSSVLEAAVTRKARLQDCCAAQIGGRTRRIGKKIAEIGRQCGVSLGAGEVDSFTEFVYHGL